MQRFTDGHPLTSLSRSRTHFFIESSIRRLQLDALISHKVGYIFFWTFSDHIMLTLDLDVLYIPRWWADCKVARNIIFWREHEKGGHFASTETPDQLVEDIREFTQSLTPETLKELTSS